MDSKSEKYEILPHSADLRIKIIGRTKKKLFQNALLAMEEGMSPEISGGKETKRKVKIKSIDLASLLVDFLNEALYLSQVNKEAYFVLKISKLTDKELAGEIVGSKAERFGEDIKAVTYHNLDVHQREDDLWEVTIVFDI